MKSRTPAKRTKAREGRGPRPAPRRQPGRPARTDNPQRIAVLVPGELRRWLRITAAERDCDMGDIVTEALKRYRRT